MATPTPFENKAPWVIAKLSRDLGISPIKAAGVVGQLGYESLGLQAVNELNPLIPGSRGGFGWAQWTGPRRRQFEDWAAAQGMAPTSDAANYGFLLHELTASPEAKVMQALHAAPEDAVAAGRVFTDTFLRPGIPGYASRDQWTRRAAALIDPAAQMPDAPAPQGNQYTLAASPAQPTKAAERPTLDGRAAAGLVQGLGRLGGSARPFEYMSAPTPQAAFVPGQAMVGINPAVADAQRQQLAATLARLNTGRLVG